ncbi:regulator of telomere elongation helicase 1 [Dendrobium catenatum]|uniref:Regulator of telomere elongation helicase 1 n=1 Tax=Dendrobium catenatum TaxID=906689 RepID=A0A2I0VUZ1_9ASPA|nr:regulator of telomere elongation helicase 1 [Dendrobium catenatum]
MYIAGLLLKLEKRIAEIPIDSKELGFTRPGHYIYEFLSDLNITNETANMLIDTIENASLLLEEGVPINYFRFPESIFAINLRVYSEILRALSNLLFLSPPEILRALSTLSSRASNLFVSPQVPLHLYPSSQQ